ncbi:MAG: single-stranded-DNA-specific exonuclease RecJ [Candidatus Sumerlaeaceae bacterium]|nr:single-stranded-DNA-specific exonuclease RecJ [Candidatus Sumerlaeaceae bacterium]
MSLSTRPAGRGAKLFHWEFREERPDHARDLAASLRISPAVARVLANRGHGESATGVDNFVNPSLSALHDPMVLSGMSEGLDRVVKAIENREKITIYGDYDTDGATSTALMLKVFHFLNVPVNYYIPHRVDEGYGLNVAAIDGLAEAGTRVLISVDCGITAVAQVAHAQARGVDVIVTDHHQPGEELPTAVAVINPNRRDCAYPNKHLTGVGVAFKFCHALLKRLRVPKDKAQPLLRSLLDLVAIGTIADVAPLSGENRILVKHGLAQMLRTTNPGILGLLRMLEMEGVRITTKKIGFQVAPRLNAAGRTDHARICVESLTADDEQLAFQIAARLDQYNRDRRAVETRIFEQTLQFIAEQVDLDRERVIVVSGRDWHVGVIGIVASRIMEVYDRPVIIISEHDGGAKGSARSIKGFNIHDALNACSDHLVTFGGHPFAAGLQLLPERIKPFRDALNDYARERLSEEALIPSLTIDTLVEPQEVDAGFIKDLEMLEPFGPSNPSPLFAMRGLRLAEQPRVVGVGGRHLKLSLSSEGRYFSAIGFGMGEHASQLAGKGNVRLDAAFVPMLNDYYSEGRVEMELKDLKLSADA